MENLKFEAGASPFQIRPQNAAVAQQNVTFTFVIPAESIKCLPVDLPILSDLPLASGLELGKNLSNLLYDEGSTTAKRKISKISDHIGEICTTATANTVSRGQVPAPY